MSNKLLKLVDDDKAIELKTMDKFLEFINQSPPDEWVKEHPLAKNVKYLPIDKVELLLKRVFQEYKVDILREGQMLNSIFVTVRLHYKHPINGWMSQDGTGAVPIQTDKDHSAADMAHIKSDAISKGLPAAESYAIKDAADKIGDVFGGNLNRKDTLSFSPLYDDKDATEIEEAIDKIAGAKNVEALRQIFKDIRSTIRVNPQVIKAKNERKETLENESN